QLRAALEATLLRSAGNRDQAGIRAGVLRVTGGRGVEGVEEERHLRRVLAVQGFVRDVQQCRQQRALRVRSRPLVDGLLVELPGAPGRPWRLHADLLAELVGRPEQPYDVLEEP